MEIAIADIEKTSTWYIIGTDIFLSFENPGPITVDASKLTQDQVNTIRAATSANVIVTKGLDELAQTPVPQRAQAKSYSKLSPDVYKAPEGLKNLPAIVTADLRNTPGLIATGDVLSDIKESKDMRKKEIKKLLDKPLYTAKKNIASMTISDLKLAFEAETEGKGRASVLTVINDMISKFNSEVSEHIAKNASNQKLPKEKPLSPQLTDIEEVEGDPVSVDVGDYRNN